MLARVGPDPVSERVAIVIPVHDESAVIEDVLEDVARVIAARIADVEIIVVDDGSTDGTGDTVAAAAVPGVRLLRLDRNLGQGPATLHGADAGSAEWICHMDGDGQLVPADFWSLWERRHDADLVLGVRRRRADPRHRLALTRIVRVAASRAAGRPLEDPAAPFRLLRRAMWVDLRPFLDEHPLALSVLVSVAAPRRGWRVAEVPIHHRARPVGRSRIGGVRLVGFVVRGARELARLDRRLRDAPEAPLAQLTAEA
jgi:dolichol-phosphate mannosyltransferase